MSQEVKTDIVNPETQVKTEPAAPVPELAAVPVPEPEAPIETEYEKLLREDREKKERAKLEERQKREKAILEEKEQREKERLAKIEKQKQEEKDREEKRQLAIPLFSCVDRDLDQFKKIVRTQSALIEELTLSISEAGVYSCFMDPSHVALLETNLPSSSFQKFECTRPGKITFRLEDFEKTLARGKKEFLKLSHLTASESLNIQLIGNRTKDYELHLIESSQSETPLPKITFDSSFELALKDIEELLKDIDVYSSHIVIRVNRDSVEFSGKGDTGKAKTAFNRDNGLKALSAEKESCSTYSIEYLDKFVKALKPEGLLFELSSKMPIRVTYKVPNSESFVRFYLAPRVQE